MPTSGEIVLFDTSAALAYVDPDNPLHGAVRVAAGSATRGLSGHAAFEFLSVLTRLPLPKRLSGEDAARLARTEFPASRFLAETAAAGLVDEFARLGITGGVVHDGLVGACARSHGATLLTCDQRADETYRLLGTTYTLVNGWAVTESGLYDGSDGENTALPAPGGSSAPEVSTG